MNGKKLADMTRDELYQVALTLIEVVKRKKGRHLPDLPPNKRANARHQRMKQIWGRKKSRMLNLLNACIPHVPPQLAEAVKYEVDHDEYLYQKQIHKPRTARGRRRQRRRHLVEGTDGQAQGT